MASLVWKAGFGFLAARRSQAIAALSGKFEGGHGTPAFRHGLCVPGFADEQLGIGVGFGYELLGATVLVVATVEVALGIDGEGVDFDIAIGQFAGHHPGVEVVAFEVELVEAEGAEVRDPDAVVIDDDVEGQGEAGEGFDEIELHGI